MRKEELSEEARKEYDELERQMLKEFEEKIPETRATLDLRPDKVRKEITNKYFPRMREILDGK